MKRKSIPESGNIPARKISRRDSIRELGEIGSREGDGEGGGEVEGEPGEHKEMGEELEEELPEVILSIHNLIPPVLFIYLASIPLKPSNFFIIFNLTCYNLYSTILKLLLFWKSKL